MSACCDPDGYRKMFRTSEAEKRGRKYRKKGLDSTAGPMVRHIVDGGVGDRSVLEVGGGSATALAEILSAGAESGVTVDISDAYLPVARRVLAEAGVSDRADVRVADFVLDTEAFESADIVFLNRVLCCYPGMEKMVDAAAGHSLGVLAMSYPRDRWFVRVIGRAGNWFLRRRKVGFQVHIHDPAAIDARAAAAGFEATGSGTTIVWHWRVWQRSG